ncbi:MAG: D-alanine--D-alanine ligase [Clostridia bacterium]|nr:D-alanine--D-alanine ligase [Clostridia bacterium]
MKQTVLVMFGGKSTEHDVSLVSASSVIRNIPTDKYNILTLGITKDGSWYLYRGDAKNIENGTWQQGDIKKAVLSPDPADGGLLVFTENGTTTRKVDVIFPVLHGKNGEDGTMQGLLELSEIPYVGCGHLSSAVTMDKAFTNLIADFHNIKQAKWLATDRTGYDPSVADQAAEKLGYPIFVKPANAGSSVGISKAHDHAELLAAIDKAFAVDDKIVFEETVVGKEIECAVLGNGDNFASILGEIAPAAEFYDYDAKYVSDSRLFIPARLEPTVAQAVQETAKKVYACMDCRGFSRVDFFITADNEIYFNEINTIPGFTGISMYPKLMEASGTPYPALIDRLLQLAVERKKRR